MLLHNCAHKQGEALPGLVAGTTSTLGLRRDMQHKHAAHFDELCLHLHVHTSTVKSGGQRVHRCVR